eukprot:541613-Prymnesium_polylepis.1
MRDTQGPQRLRCAARCSAACAASSRSLFCSQTHSRAGNAPRESDCASSSTLSDVSALSLT